MSEPRRVAWNTAGAALMAVLLVWIIDGLTNSIDIHRFSWDFRYYIALAEDGFAAPSASPFAYRFLTPLIAGGLSSLLQLSTDAGFSIVAHVGAILQLVAVFLFAYWYGKSTRGAWFAMLVTAFSLFNVKFLLFDTFRPDHLAYPLILLQVYLALTGRFGALIVATIIGCQIREFNAVPLAAYMWIVAYSLRNSAQGPARRRAISQLVISASALGAALVIPRLLIPVAEDFQFVNLTPDGMLRGLLAPFILARDANFLYSVAAFLLPALMLIRPSGLRTVVQDIRRRGDLPFFETYSVLVLVLGFLGGTDFFRFTTFLFVPQTALLCIMADKSRNLELGIALMVVFIFNRIWLPFPMSDQGAYLDFYGGYGSRFNAASQLRVIELGAFIALGALISVVGGRRYDQAARAPQ